MNGHSSITHSGQKGKNPSVHQLMDGYTKPDLYVNTTYYYSAARVKYNEVLAHATTWANLENTLSQESQP